MNYPFKEMFIYAVASALEMPQHNGRKKRRDIIHTYIQSSVKDVSLNPQKSRLILRFIYLFTIAFVQCSVYLAKMLKVHS